MTPREFAMSPEQPPPGSAAVIVYEDSSSPSRRHGRASQLISVAEVDEDLTFELQRQRDGGFTMYGRTPVRNRERLRQQIADLLETMAKRRSAKPENTRTLERTFQSEAEALFDNLIPKQLGKLIRHWPNNTCVGIATNEAWVPWELLHDTQGFLWQRFLLYRLPKLNHDLDPPDLLAAPATGLDQSPVPRGFHVIHVVGGGVGKERCGALSKILPGPEEGCQVRVLTGLNGDEVVVQLGDAVVIHFDCHGHANPPRLRTRADSIPELQLNLSLV
jgi:hypothetical protein